MAKKIEHNYVSVEKLKDYKGLRFTSGKSIYEEALDNGRLIVRFWNPSFNVEPGAWVAAQLNLVKDWAIESFSLNIDGQSLAFGWQWRDFSEISSSKRNVRHGVLTLFHPLRKIEMKIHTYLDGTPFMTRWLEIKNCSKMSAALSSVSPWSGNLFWTHNVTPSGVGADESPYRLGYFASRHWGTEGDFRWIDIPLHTIAIESENGMSGHSHPFFFIKDNASGRSIVAQLAWSGNWRAEFSVRTIWNDDSRLLFFTFGPKAPSPLRVIAPNETVSSPQVHLAVMEEDFDGCVQALHTHLRRSVLPPWPKGREQLVICNLGVVEDNNNEAQLSERVDMAERVGCEVCIVDAGWYANKGEPWWDREGDWRPAEHLPKGLKPILEKIHKKGMLFGLWVEIEAVGAKSDLKKKHPDWIIQKGDAPVASGGMLDLAKTEVAEWVEAELIRIIEQYKLDLLRLDYNTKIFEGGYNERGGFLESAFCRHYEAFYGILERLRKKFPKLLIENCAGGGGRTDIGILSHCDTTWISDWFMPPRLVKILNGLTIALPPERLNRFYCFTFTGDFDFQMRAALFSHLAVTDFAPSKEAIIPEKFERIKSYIKLYKDFVRPMLATCRVYHHTPELPGNDPYGFCVLEYVSDDASRGYAGIFRLLDDGENTYHFKSRGLDPSARYKVTFCNSGGAVEISGTDLRLKGLEFSFENVLTSELLLFERK